MIVAQTERLYLREMTPDDAEQAYLRQLRLEGGGPDRLEEALPRLGELVGGGRAHRTKGLNSRRALQGRASGLARLEP